MRSSPSWPRPEAKAIRRIALQLLLQHLEQHPADVEALRQLRALSFEIAGARASTRTATALASPRSTVANTLEPEPGETEHAPDGVIGPGGLYTVRLHATPASGLLLAIEDFGWVLLGDAEGSHATVYAFRDGPSPAEEAGVQLGSRVVAVNGTAVRGYAPILEQLGACEGGAPPGSGTVCFAFRLQACSGADELLHAERHRKRQQDKWHRFIAHIRPEPPPKSAWQNHKTASCKDCKGSAECGSLPCHVHCPALTHSGPPDTFTLRTRGCV